MKIGKAAGFAFVLGITLSGAASDHMQVEEPGLAAMQAVDAEKEAGQWKDMPAMSPREKAADSVRRHNMQEMVRIIQEKRKALQLAGQSDKSQRAQELQDLMLSDPGKDAEKKAAKAEAKLQRREETRQKQLEKKLEKEKKKQEKEKNKPGNNKPGS